MSEKYSYPIESFTSGLALGTFHAEIVYSSAILKELLGVFCEEGIVTVEFVESLDLSEVNSLTTLVSLHQGISLADPVTEAYTRETAYDILNRSTPQAGDLAYAIDVRRFTFYDGDSWKLMEIDGPLVGPDQGLGPSGTYVEDFEADFGHWITGSDIGEDPNESYSLWSRITGSTPSSTTGSSGAHTGSFYCYTETSSGAHLDTFLLQCDYFSRLDSVNFFYHMYGADMGTLEFQYYDIVTDSWNTIWSQAGEDQTKEKDDYIEVNLDVTSYRISKVRFKYSGASNYAADCCIDYVTLVSS